MARASFQGAYYDGVRPKRLKAEARVGPSRLRILAEGGIDRQWPYEAIVPVHSAGQVRLTHGEEAFVTEDAAILEAVRSRMPEKARSATAWVAQVEGRVLLMRAIFAFVGMLAAGLAMQQWGLAVVADVASAFVPVSWEEELGQRTLKELSEGPNAMLPLAKPEPKRDALLQEIAKRLTGALPQPQPYTYRVLTSSRQELNAFALPGGTMVVFQGLITAMPGPEALAGVLAHEVQHVAKRHSTKALTRALAVDLATASLGGDLSWGALLGGVKLVGQAGASRQAEAEADVEGLKLMDRAGLGTRGMLHAFKAMSAQEGWSPSGLLGLLSDHPPTQDRLASLQAASAGLRSEPTHPLSLVQPWSRFQREAKAPAKPKAKAPGSIQPEEGEP